jgi:hypothetical protein
MLAALLVSAAVTACPIEQARYALRTEPVVTAVFTRVDSGRDWPTGLAMRIDSHGHLYWFLPFGGGTGGAQYLASTLDVTRPDWTPPNPDGGPRPLGSLDYLGFDATYRVLGDVPRRSDAAPAHILLPGLSDRLWHAPPGAERDAVPRQVFDLVRCESR